MKRSIPTHNAIIYKRIAEISTSKIQSQNKHDIYFVSFPRVQNRALRHISNFLSLHSNRTVSDLHTYKLYKLKTNMNNKTKKKRLNEKQSLVPLLL